MSKRWDQIRDDWLSSTSLPKEIAKWAIEVFNTNQKAIDLIEKEVLGESDTINEGNSPNQKKDHNKEMRRKIKNDITC